MAYENYKYGYIYITTNLINGKKYIGKRARKKQELDYYGSGKLINLAIQKYGIENFKCDIIRWCYSKDECNRMEKYYITFYNAIESPMFYNIAEGGIGGDTYSGRTDEEMKITRIKLSESKKGSKNGNKGQYIGPLNSMYGKEVPLERRRRISESLKSKFKTYEIKVYLNGELVNSAVTKTPVNTILRLVGRSLDNKDKIPSDIKTSNIIEFEINNYKLISHIIK